MRGCSVSSAANRVFRNSASEVDTSKFNVVIDGVRSSILLGSSTGGTSMHVATISCALSSVASPKIRSEEFQPEPKA